MRYRGLVLLMGCAGMKPRQWHEPVAVGQTTATCLDSCASRLADCLAIQRKRDDGDTSRCLEDSEVCKLRCAALKERDE